MGQSSKAYKSAWYQANKERMKILGKERYEKKKQEILKQNAEYKLAHPEQTKAIKKRWSEKNKAYYAAKCAERYARKLKATPKWANKFFIQEAYDLARRRTKILGYPWHVDHIVPLKSPVVCGLHVEHNLRVIPGVQNQKKYNKVHG